MEIVCGICGKVPAACAGHYIGLDLASKPDQTALTVVFPLDPSGAIEGEVIPPPRVHTFTITAKPEIEYASHLEYGTPRRFGKTELMRQIALSMGLKGKHAIDAATGEPMVRNVTPTESKE